MLDDMRCFWMVQMERCGKVYWKACLEIWDPKCFFLKIVDFEWWEPIGSRGPTWFLASFSGRSPRSFPNERNVSPVFCICQPKEVCSILWLSNQPPPNLPPRRNMDLIAGLIKGNQPIVNEPLVWPYFWGGCVGGRLTHPGHEQKQEMDRWVFVFLTYPHEKCQARIQLNLVGLHPGIN